MILALIFLLVDILYGIKVSEVNISFFDKNNTQAMRGFWCIIVMFVHVPASYQNTIQDLIGCFGFIGVTFFFLTSAYGVTMSLDKNSNSIKNFWRKRLPKLLIVSWTIDVFFYLVRTVLYREYVNPINLIYVDDWVKWLLGCLFALWVSNKLLKKTLYWKVSTCVIVVLWSLLVYYLVKIGVFTHTAWTTECYGFVWGIILGTIRPYFLKYFSDRWSRKWIISLLVSLVLGVLYLKFKWLPFAGDYLLKILLGIAITMFVLIANTRISFGNKINMFLGEISFEIYLVHGYVFNIFEKYYEWNNSSVFIMMSIITTVMCSYIIHLIDVRLIRAATRIINV
ncbi:acyltransferase family protein [Pseudobutyrivibrio sp. ACV-2]|uniref:acyltransferase family protein n=1 Tax=Pseudobutyrivibrio sp. ACV-2 TaxID=1520801 RepID=UPI00147A6CEF|nr:acyltransferase family protein [Pseudobutyrivibrio sp. ACV-2]